MGSLPVLTAKLRTSNGSRADVRGGTLALARFGSRVPLPANEAKRLQSVPPSSGGHPGLSLNNIRLGVKSIGKRLDNALSLELLRRMEVVHSKRQRATASSLARTIEDFGRYLLRERCLSEATLKNYLPFVDLFLFDRFKDGNIDLSRIQASDVTRFVQRRVRTVSPKRVKLLVTSVRSLLSPRLEVRTYRSSLKRVTGSAGLPLAVKSIITCS